MAAPNQPDAILSATDLGLSYGNQAVLDGATLAIRPGQKIGLVGRNGSGKSSFLRIAAGTEQPDSGTVARRQGLVVGYLAQDFQLDENASVADNIRSGAAALAAKVARFESGAAGEDELAKLQADIDARDGWNLETRITALMRTLATPPAERVAGYCSGGEKRRIGLCRALLPQPDLLILDEPTNHLDPEAIEWLEGHLAGYGGACLFVTHDRYFLDRVASHIVELDGGRFFLHEGGYSDFLVARAERQGRAEAAESKRQRFLRREIEWVRAGIKARGTKQRSRLDHFHAVKARKAPERELEMELILPPAPPLGNIILDARGLGMIAEAEPLFLGLDLELRVGECIGIVGKNGAGKTTLLKALLGQLPPTEGSVRMGKKTQVNYVDQGRIQLDDDLSILQEVGGDEEFVQFGDEKLAVRSYLKRFLFSDDRINDRIGHLSGGERNRVLLAKILRRGGNLLVLDEPTNDLDLQTLRVLEEALVNFGGTSLVVSHDRYFLDRVCDRLIVFNQPPTIEVVEGNYSYLREKRAERATTSAATGPTSDRRGNAAPERKANRSRKLSFNETRELDAMEETILAAEDEITTLERKLNDPGFYIDHAHEAVGLNAKLEERRATTEALYRRWEELEAIRGGAAGS
jgi:ATP-binding cassette subfamily F protein uup